MLGTTTFDCGINTFKREVRECIEVTKAVPVSFTESRKVLIVDFNKRKTKKRHVSVSILMRKNYTMFKISLPQKRNSKIQWLGSGAVSASC